MNDSNSSNRGCLLAMLFVAAVLVLGGIVVATFLFRVNARDSAMLRHEEVQMAHEAALKFDTVETSDGAAVVLERTTIGDYSPTQLGETLEAKHYVAVACAPNLTSLAKQKFIEAAEGMPIDWRVRVEDIKADANNEGKISGQFSMSYELHERNSRYSSTIAVSATFPEEKSTDLISLRNGDFVRIRGKLRILNDSTNAVRVIDPEIVIGDE